MERIGIRVRGVRKRLGKNQALDRADARFEPGFLHGVIGPDGAGKTTLMRTLIGLLKPDQGEIAFEASGKPVPFAEVRPSMAYMPQQQSLYPDLSVAEHLEFFRDLYGLPEGVFAPRREELLRITRLERFAERRAAQLSGGMYKKLGLMCALLQSPSVLLLDEPTNGVDPISRREFWDLVYRLSGQGILVVMTTAYMDEAERCGRVHLLEGGRVLAEGEPRSVLEREGAASFEELFLRRAVEAR
ncbi:MAG: ABC transporter ATP-binding protein [Elusimicrobia bacterium]|nr:ABC transporter ATP-binding protein [Elusimicrobiota bacterium]